jgi:hypothetical protein
MRSLAGIAGFESNRGQGCLSFVSVVCFQIEVSVSGRSLVRRSPTECGVSECDLGTSTVRMPRSTRSVETRKQQRVACNVNINVFRKILTYSVRLIKAVLAV